MLSLYTVFIVVIPFYKRLCFWALFSVSGIVFAGLARGNEIDPLTQELSFFVEYKAGLPDKHNNGKNLFFSGNDDTREFISDISFQPTARGVTQDTTFPESPVSVEWQPVGWGLVLFFYSVKVSVYAHLFQAPAAVLKIVLSTIASQFPWTAVDPLSPPLSTSAALAIYGQKEEGVNKVIEHVSIRDNDVTLAKAKIWQEMKVLTGGYDHIANNTYMVYMMRSQSHFTTPATGQDGEGDPNKNKPPATDIPADCQRSGILYSDESLFVHTLKRRRHSSDANCLIESDLFRLVRRAGSLLDCQVSGSGKQDSTIIDNRDQRELTRDELIDRIVKCFQSLFDAPLLPTNTAQTTSAIVVPDNNDIVSSTTEASSSDQTEYIARLENTLAGWTELAGYDNELIRALRAEVFRLSLESGLPCDNSLLSDPETETELSNTDVDDILNGLDL